MSDLPKNPKIFGFCGEPGCKPKYACKLVFYCGEECQRNHWPDHKEGCTVNLARKITGAREEHVRDGEEVGRSKFEAAEKLKLQGRYEEAKQCCPAALRIYSKLEGGG